MRRCKKLFQNITRDFFEIQNLRLWYFSTSECTVRDFLIQKIRQFRIFVSNSCFLKMQRKCKTCRFLGVTWFNIWFFVCKLLKYLARFEAFNSKSDALYIFYFKIWHVIKTFVQNLTHRKHFNWNFDTL